MLSRCSWHDSHARQSRAACQLAKWAWAVVLLTAPSPCFAWIGAESPRSQKNESVNAKNASSWTSLGLGGGGAMFTPAISPVDPNLILLNCDMSGGYRSIDGGKSWELIHYQQLTGSTRVCPVWHPTDPAIAFSGDGWRGGIDSHARNVVASSSAFVDQIVRPDIEPG